MVHGHRLLRTVLVKREEIGAQPSMPVMTKKTPLASRRSAAEEYCVRAKRIVKP
jgi:hypothetical protein